MTGAEMLALIKACAAAGAKLKAIDDKRLASVGAEYRELMDEVLVETTASVDALVRVVAEHGDDIADVRADLLKLVTIIDAMWEGVDEQQERPIEADLAYALKRFADDHDRAGTNAKRRQLLRALVGEFDPQFFRDGWSRILGEMARRLEPPHVELLRKMRDHVRSKSPALGHGRRQAYYGSHVTSDEYPLLLDLAAVGLVYLATNATGPIEVRVSDVADRFITFLSSVDEPSGPLEPKNPTLSTGRDT